jgi:hypothetical protein
VKKDLNYQNDSFKSVPFSLFASHFGPPILRKTLGHLDNALLEFFADRTLAELVDEITVIANEYVIWKTRSSPEIVDSAPTGTFPVSFPPSELENDPWVQLKPELTMGTFDFSRFTPRRLFAAEEVMARV